MHISKTYLDVSKMDLELSFLFFSWGDGDSGGDGDGAIFNLFKNMFCAFLFKVWFGLVLQQIKTYKICFFVDQMMMMMKSTKSMKLNIWGLLYGANKKNGIVRVGLGVKNDFLRYFMKQRWTWSLHCDTKQTLEF